MNESRRRNAEIAELQRNEIIEALEAAKLRNAEFDELVACLTAENRIYKTKYPVLKQRVDRVNEYLEQNARIFSLLFEKIRNTLQRGRTSVSVVFNNSLECSLGSNTPEQAVGIREKPSVKPSPKPGVSGDNFYRRKIHIERLNKKDLEQSLENREISISENHYNREGTLTTLAEENTSTQSENRSKENDSTFDNISRARNIIREVSVRLSRLPHNVVEDHLHPSLQNLTGEHQKKSFLNTSESFSMPNITSTPLQVETMEKLGLCPSNMAQNFINTRKKVSVNKDTVSRATKRSTATPEKTPENIKKTKRQNDESPKSSKKKMKKQKKLETRLVLRSPRVRKAKPVHLKEPPLGKKLRAN